VCESIAAADRARELVAGLDARLFDGGTGDPRLTRATAAIERTADSGTAIAETGLRQIVSQCDDSGVGADATDGQRGANGRSAGDQ